MRAGGAQGRFVGMRVRLLNVIFYVWRRKTYRRSINAMPQRHDTGYDSDSSS